MEQPDIISEDIEAVINSPVDWKAFKNKTVLITGASGMLAGYMVEVLMSLNKKGYQIKVIALERDLERAKARFKDYLKNKDFVLLIQDVASKITYRGKVDYAVHAASQASPKYYAPDPVGTLSANTLGTLNLLELAAKKKANGFLFFSSSEVYGKISKSKIAESDYGYLDPLNVRSCYAESKRMGETICVSFLQQFGVPVKIIRPFHTFGPGMRLDDGRVFADFIRDIVSKKNIEMKSDGKTVRSFCYLADAVVAYFLVLLSGKSGEAYNIGGAKGISIFELAKILVGLFPENKLKVIPVKRKKSDHYMESKADHSCPDLTKIKKLGWKPKFSITEAFRRTILSYEKGER